MAAKKNAVPLKTIFTYSTAFVSRVHHCYTDSLFPNRFNTSKSFIQLCYLLENASKRNLNHGSCTLRSRRCEIPISIHRNVDPLIFEFSNLTRSLLCALYYSHYRMPFALISTDRNNAHATTETMNRESNGSYNNKQIQIGTYSILTCILQEPSSTSFPSNVPW